MTDEMDTIRALMEESFPQINITAEADNHADNLIADDAVSAFSYHSLTILKGLWEQQGSPMLIDNQTTLPDEQWREYLTTCMQHMHFAVNAALYPKLMKLLAREGDDPWDVDELARFYYPNVDWVASLMVSVAHTLSEHYRRDLAAHADRAGIPGQLLERLIKMLHEATTDVDSAQKMVYAAVHHAVSFFNKGFSPEVINRQAGEQ